MMIRKLIRKALSICLILLFLLGLLYCTRSRVEHADSGTRYPNVLLISADDMKDWVGYMGGYEGEVYTPNIDRLAAMGEAFTNAHTAATVCCPSRNALMLGKRPSSTGLYNNNQWWKAACPGEIPLPQYFRMHGYIAAGAGKVFHHTPGNNPPCCWDEYREQEFDDPWNFASWSPERYFVTYGYRGPIIPYPEWKPMNGIFPIRSELDWGPLPGKNEEEYGDLRAVEFAENFLKREHDKPFFLAVGIYRPHLPWHVPGKYFDLYPREEIVLPLLWENDLDDIPEAGKKLALSTFRDFEQIREEGKWKEAIQAYLASISFADAQVGSILKALETNNYRDNTIIIFWSDHGWHFGTKQHWHKQTLWEECTRIPFIMKVPGTTGPGSTCRRPVDMVNVFPTLLSLCGLPDLPGLDGHDMSPLLENPDTSWAYPAISEIQTGNMSVRSQDWHYIRYHDGSEELYDCTNDPFEWDNKSSEEEYRAVLASHRSWVPDTFAAPVPDKQSFLFDPHEYTFINRKNKTFIDGKN